MNKNFINYATSTAFAISLSKSQVKMLNAIALPDNSAAQLDLLTPQPTMVTGALMNKGLIEYSTGRKLVLTEPGRLVVELLKEADLLNLGRKQMISRSMVKRVEKDMV